MDSIGFFSLPNSIPTSVHRINPLFSLPTRRRLPILNHRHFTVLDPPTQTQRLETKLFVSPRYDTMNMEEKLLLGYAVLKTDKYISVVFAKKLMDASLIKLGEEAGVENDPLWARLNSESEFVSKFKMERNDAVMNYMLHKESLETSEEYILTVLQL